MKKILISIFFIILYFFPVFVLAEIKPIVEGNKDAKIKLIIFESLTCSHCGTFHKNIYPSLKEDFIDKGYVNIEFKNFPLDVAALNASKIAHCKNDGSSDILHYLFKNQEQWIKGNSIEELNKSIRTFIEKSNFKINFDECINDSSLEDYVLEDRIKGAKMYKIESTPTLIINEEKFENPLDYKKLKKYLKKMI
tara:strand:+ start:643 stop:1224 length:582 start_codon:yes stop_codon:yes gene_type:complete